MRRREGIDDAELRAAVRGLRAGEVVRLTLVPRGPTSHGETVLVRITSIKGETFRGKVAEAPPRHTTLRPGAAVTFTGDHIHSIPRQSPDVKG
jgi:hypothetical protein